ncbi:ABC transporter substrate-binding protein [Brevibacillus thermoruber]|uniref:ABC transporter substrate-binding protein n=1 Tax=Brevibacillus thermoruber TaxID=33942 RepID=UPI0040436CE5
MPHPCDLPTPYADHLFAIGETAAVKGVAGLKSLRNFPVYEAYTKEGKIADLGDEPHLEKILELNPDVIISWEGDENRYEQLSKIAPTILIPSSENWQVTIMQVAAVMGEEEKAQQYIDSYRQKLKDVASLMEQSGEKGKTALFLMTWGKGFNYYGGVRMSPYYKELGFTPFDKMGDYGEISLEGVSELNPDYIFLGEDFTRSADVALKELEQNPVWKNLRAVKNNRVFVVDTEIMGPLAMGQYKGLDVIESIMKGGK